MEAGGRLLQAVLPPDDPRAAPQLQRCSAPVNGNTQALVDLITDLSEAPFELLGAGVPVRYALITCERGRQPATLFIGMHHVLRLVPYHGRLDPAFMQTPELPVCRLFVMSTTFEVRFLAGAEAKQSLSSLHCKCSCCASSADPADLARAATASA